MSEIQRIAVAFLCLSGWGCLSPVGWRLLPSYSSWESSLFFRSSKTPSSERETPRGFWGQESVSSELMNWECAVTSLDEKRLEGRKKEQLLHFPWGKWDFLNFTPSWKVSCKSNPFLYYSSHKRFFMTKPIQSPKCLLCSESSLLVFPLYKPDLSYVVFSCLFFFFLLLLLFLLSKVIHVHFWTVRKSRWAKKE